MFCKFVKILFHPSHIVDAVIRRLLRSDCFLAFYHVVIIPLLEFRIRHKKTVTVIFLAMNADMWRYDEVYRKLLRDPRFKPLIITAMRENEPMQDRIETQEKLVHHFNEKGYHVVAGYDVETRSWINIDRFKPDLIFYTQPYSGIIEDKFEFRHRLLVLHCYAPYSFQLSTVWWNWNNDLQNYCWKHFLPWQYQIKICQEHSRVKGRNVVEVGYCLEEEMASIHSECKLVNEAWKCDRRKRIIWAPHHSIKENEMFKVSSFLEIADLMLLLRDEYADKVVFAFKPHPVLKSKLEADWGVDRTARYYAEWANSDASFDARGDYRYLFAGSDAMIHCSGSFILEYLYTGKPVQYVYSKVRNPPDMGEIGDAALDVHYPARSEADIREFLDSVVLGSHDVLLEKRKEFVERHLRSQTGQYFSENVYGVIKEALH